MSLPSFPSLSERSGLDKEVGTGLDEEVGMGLDKDGGFRMEDEDVEADVVEDDAFLSDLVGAGLSEWDFSR